MCQFFGIKPLKKESLNLNVFVLIFQPHYFHLFAIKLFEIIAFLQLHVGIA